MGHLATLVSKYPGGFWHRQGECGLRCQAPYTARTCTRPPEAPTPTDAGGGRSLALGAVRKQLAHLRHTPDFPGKQAPCDSGECGGAWVSRTELLSILESLVGSSCRIACSHRFCLSRCCFTHPEEEPGCWSLDGHPEMRLCYQWLSFPLAFLLQLGRNIDF